MKKLITVMICILLLLTLVSPALAASVGGSPKIVDNANLLTDSQERILEEHAEKLAEIYAMDVVILTVYSLDGKDVESYADDYFDYNGYGIGDDYSGVLFMLSMEYRDWAISTCGETIYALTDYGQQQIFSEISGDLADDDYYNAFTEYLDQLDRYFEAYADGKPIDGGKNEYDGPGSFIPGSNDETVYYDEPDSGDILMLIGISVVIGLAAAFIAIWVMSSKMNTARPQHGAKSYMVGGSYKLKTQQDIYLFSRTSRTRRSESSSGGGHGGSRGGSSTHRSSSGRSHGGSHGKF